MNTNQTTGEPYALNHKQVTDGDEPALWFLYQASKAKEYFEDEYCIAIEALITKAEQGDEDLMFDLYCFYDGWGEDKTQAAKWLFKSAENGNVCAQRELARHYRRGHYGLGIEQDYSEAAKWLTRAVANKDSGAMIELAHLCEKGIGVEQDTDKAMSLYLDASEYKEEEDTNVYALYRWILLCNREKNGCDYGIEEAVKKIREKAENDDNAKIYLAMLYREGIGVNHNDSEAIRLFCEAKCAHELKYTDNNTEYISEETILWWQTLAGKGYDWAEYNVGRMYEDGKVVRRNVAEAVKWYKKSAEHGNIRAKCRLAWRFHYLKYSEEEKRLTDILRGMIYEAMENKNWPVNSSVQALGECEDFTISASANTMKFIFAKLREMAADNTLMYAYNMRGAKHIYRSISQTGKPSDAVETGIVFYGSIDNKQRRNYKDGIYEFVERNNVEIIHIFYSKPYDDLYREGEVQESCTLFLDDLPVTFQNTDGNSNTEISFHNRRLNCFEKPLSFAAALYKRPW